MQPPLGMHADEVLTEGLRSDVRTYVEKLNDRMKRARRGKVGGVHDTRTVCRRLRTYLDLMGRSVFRSGPAERAGARLAKIETSLAKTRDLDSLLNDLEGYIRLHRSSARVLRGVHDVIGERRKRAVRAARRTLSKRSRRAIVDRLDALLEHGWRETPKKSFTAAPFLVRHFTHELIWHRYDMVRAFEPSLPGDEETTHRFRSACRELRFAMELFGEALRDSPPIVADLVAVQEQIGEMHDHHVAVRLLRKYAARGIVNGSPELDAYVAERSAARDRLKARFEERWAAHLDTAFRLRLAGAIESEMPAAA